MRQFNKTKVFLGKLIDKLLIVVFAFWKVFSHKELSTERSPVNRIIIFEFFLLGDLMMATSTLRAIRRGFENSKITLLAAPFAKDLKGNIPWVDKLITFRCPWSPMFRDYSLQSFKDAWKTLTRLRTDKYDLAIDLRGDFRNILFMYLTGAKRRVGYDITGGGCLLTDVVPFEKHKYRHQLEGNLAIARYLNCRIISPYPQLSIPPKDKQWARNFLLQYRMESFPMIGIHPGAREANKLWETDKWAKLIGCIVSSYNAKVLVFYAGKEKEIVKQIRNLACYPDSVVPISAPLPSFIALVNQLDLLIGLDSGPVHIAAAVGTPSVVLFGPKEPSLSQPYSTETKVVMKPNFSCRPCGIRCIRDRNECMRSISVDEVFAQVTKFLQSNTEQLNRSD